MKKYLIGAIAIICIALIIIIVTKNKNKGEPLNQELPIVQELEDGTKLNTSEKLKDVKIVEGLEISNIQITEKDGMSLILADVKNKTSGEKGGFTVDIKLTDKSGEEIVTVVGYIKKLTPGEKTQLNTSATLQFVEAYDFTIVKK